MSCLADRCGRWGPRVFKAGVLWRFAALRVFGQFGELARYWLSKSRHVLGPFAQTPLSISSAAAHEASAGCAVVFQVSTQSRASSTTSWIGCRCHRL